MADRVIIAECSNVGLATIMARRGVERHLLEHALEMTVPNAPSWISRGDLTLIGTGPDVWLARTDEPSPGWIDTLRVGLSSLASVAEHSSGYRLFRLSGLGARTVLQRGAAVDLHQDSFWPGSASVVSIAHIGVIIRQLDDQPAYELAVPRSYFSSFRRWLDQAAGAL